ncbi:DUF2786 domain-containing protein [Lentzea sp. BCCO 10_0856]|uniref:DUF2786 domain-containing protein n=1 Tax=Lentzea miocenica TaxID=3095431 RepID=A0ABU4T7Q5_9PSEU|nr:DUF2786 domain-containing protein [Lentzea sp. BCCO 10_0856]MDX8034104.1 DUF2786 domain-containing protein [Lentzea sp. BCCO 10_0856]
MKAVDALWQRGWLPYDVREIVSRSLDESAASLVVDVIALSCSPHVESTVHPRWRRQLDEIGASVWWEGPLLEAWATRHIETRAYASRTAADLLAFLGRLPSLPLILPLPGDRLMSAVRAGLDPKVLNRVRGLLAKAESTSFPEEAEALSGKAQELMNRHALERAMLDADLPALATSRRMWLDKSYFKEKSQLVHVVATAFRSRAVAYDGFGFIALVGDEVDLEGVELLSTSLLVQATRAMVAVGGKSGKGSEARSRPFRKSFLVAFASRISERLTDTPDEVVSDERLLPVLADRKKAVDTLFEEMFTRTRTSRVTVRSAAGWGAGRAAADAADIGTGRKTVTSG